MPAKPKRLLIARSDAFEMLDVSKSTGIRMEQAGRLTPVILYPGSVVRYPFEQVEAIAQPKPDIERKQFGPKPKLERLKLKRRA